MRSVLPVIAAAVLLGCLPGANLPTNPRSGPMEASGQCSGDFGASASAQKLEVFLLSTSAFVGAAAEVQGSLLLSCRRMGEALGMSATELSGTGDDALRSVCDGVSARLRAELAELKSEAKLTVKVSATPPSCEVRMDAYAKCAAECDVTVEEGKLDLACEGGEIVGQCSGECSGECAVAVEGRCGGECQGTCQGGCSGTCKGTCEGTCSAKGPNGECNGRCSGTCQGTCSAGCKGSCSGECWMTGRASCEGECRGGCSVAYTEPRCTGSVKPPRVEADCEASCNARLSADARCKPGKAQVLVTGRAKGEAEAKLARVRAALEVGWADVQLAGIRLAQLKAAGDGMVRSSKGLGSAVGSLGLRAGACVTEAAAALPRAVASVGVSIDVQVSVSASMSASAG